MERSCYGFKEQCKDDSVKVTAQLCQDTEYGKNGLSECVECFLKCHTLVTCTLHTVEPFLIWFIHFGNHFHTRVSNASFCKNYNCKTLQPSFLSEVPTCG